MLTDVLRDLGAEVLYVTELLQDVLDYQLARDEAIASVLADTELGDVLGGIVRDHLESLAPGDLASVLVAGLTAGELRSGSGLVYDLLDPHDFVIDPLPNLVFTKDSSIWIGDQAIVASLPGPRRRETDLMAVIYGHHPRFGGLQSRFEPGDAQLHGGDVLLLAPGVIAVGVGVRTSPASAERLARHLLKSGVAGTVLAVPMNQRGEGGHLDRVCTVMDAGIVMMTPALAFTLTALTIASRGDEVRVSRPQPFLEAAARALGVDRLSVIDTGVDSSSSAVGQWDDGGNALAFGPGVAVCNERNIETNSRLAGAGFEVITVPGNELGAFRGGPRSLCAPICRDPAPVRALDESKTQLAPRARVPLPEQVGVHVPRVPAPVGPVDDEARRVAGLARSR